MQVLGIDLSMEKLDVNFIDVKGKERNREVKNGVVWSVFLLGHPSPNDHERSKRANNPATPTKWDCPHIPGFLVVMLFHWLIQVMEHQFDVLILAIKLILNYFDIQLYI